MRDAVRWLSVFCWTIGPSASSRARSEVTVVQITPDVCCRKKAIDWGVANSAAMIRSPSFSRSSSSTTTTISPRPIAAIAFSMSSSAMGSILLEEEAFHVLGDEVDLEVHLVAGAASTEGRDLGGVADDGDGEVAGVGFDDGEAAALDGDRALLDDVAGEAGRDRDAQVRRRLHHRPDG